MWFRALFNSLKSRPARGRPTGRPRFEALEDRLCPSAATFSPTVIWPAGAAPFSVAVGDFDGDGRHDLAVANLLDSGNVSVLLGNGSGGFGAAANFPAGAAPFSVAVGDFDGDGRPDLAVANSSSNSDSGNVSVLLGDGRGGFGAPVNFAAGGGPSSVAVGDFNGDGRPDLAVANSGSGNVSVLLGNGGGGFGAPVNFPAGDSPRSVAVGDFDGDGRPDLAVANSSSNSDSGNVSVLLGDGRGGFGAPVNFAAGGGPSSVAVGDFNGDGRPDLAVTNVASGNVSVLLGDGRGNFGTAPAPALPVGGAPQSVAVGDFDGDGRPDLAVANYYSGDVSVLLGDGSGGFGAPVNFPAGDALVSVAVGDFNGDGRPDLAVANASSDNVSVLLNTTPPTLPSASVPPPALPSAAPSSAPAPSAFTGAQVVGDILVLTGASVPGGVQFAPVPRGSFALFTDLTGDGRGDVILVLPNLTLILDGRTGRFMALGADDDGDGTRDLWSFNLDGTTTHTDGRTGLVRVF